MLITEGLFNSEAITINLHIYLVSEVIFTMHAECNINIKKCVLLKTLISKIKEVFS